jgi:hypothetical protein
MDDPKTRKGRVMKFNKLISDLMRSLFVGDLKEETCFPGSWDPNRPTKGHCAALSVAIHIKVPDAKLASCMVDGQSHWFLVWNSEIIDPTYDQFDHDVDYAVGFRFRELSHANEETMNRARMILS